MSTLHPQILKYGLGIVSDITGLDLDSREFASGNLEIKIEGGKIELFSGAPEYSLGNNTSIKNNFLFAKTAAEARDSFKITAAPGENKITIKNTGNALGRVLVIVPKNTTVTIIEERTFKDYCGLIIDVVVEAGAHLTYVAPPALQTEYCAILRTGYVQENATLTWFDLNRGGVFTKIDTVTKLLGAGARSETYGIFFGEAAAKFDLYHCTEHHAGNTHSNMATKGVLNEKSRAIHRSLIQINQNMAGCTGHERTDTLMLSPQAGIDAVPELEIGNNEVQCTHAVSTTRLSPEKLFYLEGRGLDKGGAKKMLVEAHLESILGKNPKSTIISIT